MNGLAELITGEPTVEITKSEFESLVRQSERNDLIERLMKINCYISDAILQAIIYIPEEETEEEEKENNNE